MKSGVGLAEKYCRVKIDITGAMHLFVAVIERLASSGALFKLIRVIDYV